MEAFLHRHLQREGERAASQLSLSYPFHSLCLKLVRQGQLSFTRFPQRAVEKVTIVRDQVPYCLNERISTVDLTPLPFAIEINHVHLLIRVKDVRGPIGFQQREEIRLPFQTRMWSSPLSSLLFGVVSRLNFAIFEKK